MNPPLAVLATGLVTAVGQTAPATCAALRAKVKNSQELRFIDWQREWLMGCPVVLDQPYIGTAKLAEMAALAIAECLAQVPESEWQRIPLCLCLPERERAGRIDGLDANIYRELCTRLGSEFAPHSVLIPNGRVSVATALSQAATFLNDHDVPMVVIAATDSLLTWAQLAPLERQQRLLTSANSNGFLPGEAAGAVLIGRASPTPRLLCMGVGFAAEQATIESELPMRAEGLSQAVRKALAQASYDFDQLDFRISDVSGEQYYFKEAALTVSRIMRQRKEEFDLWHPAECTGEVGAAAGLVGLALAESACRKGYAPGPGILLHGSNDRGARAAVILRYEAN